MQTELSFNQSVADILAEVKHALVLTNAINFLLQDAQLVQTDLHVVQEVADGVVQKVQLVDVLLVDLVALDLRKAPRVLVLPLGEQFATFLDFILEDGYVLLQSLHFKQALLSLIQIDVLVHVRGNAKLAGAGGY